MRKSELRACSGFTLMELVVVITIVGLLMGLVLGIQKYAQTKSSRSRAEAQIAGFVSALEAYKADNAAFPTSPETELLSPMSTGTSFGYEAPNLFLYKELSGDADGNGKSDASESKSDPKTVYFSFTSSMLKMENGAVRYIRDPWGNPYGYSTSRASKLAAGTDDPSSGHNITFDLWSTAGQDSKPDSWVSNW